VATSTFHDGRFEKWVPILFWNLGRIHSLSPHKDIERTTMAGARGLWLVNGRFKTKLLITVDVLPGRYDVYAENTTRYMRGICIKCTHTPLKPGLPHERYRAMLEVMQEQYWSIPKIGAFEKKFSIASHCRRVFQMP